MATTLRGFGIKIKEVGAALPGRSDRLLAQLLVVCTATVVLRTPVDTGRARANWVATQGAPFAGTLPPPASAGAGAGEAVARATAVAGAYRGGAGLFLRNGLPYIGRLNSGSSTQAPANFVRDAVNAAVKKVQSSRILR